MIVPNHLTVTNDLIVVELNNSNSVFHNNSRRTNSYYSYMVNIKVYDIYMIVTNDLTVTNSY